jgi:hypothetical protein
MTTIILIVICFLVVANVLVWTFATAALHVKKSCTKNHYFWCDSGWECCTTPNCSASKSLGTEDGTKAVDSYKLTDRVYGTDNYYYQGCIQPMNSLLAALKPGEDVSTYSLNCIYCTKNSTGNYVLNSSDGGTPKNCTPSDCNVPNGFKYQGQTCSNPGGCNDSTSNTGMNGVLTGACTYLPFEDIPSNQNNTSTAATTNWLPFYPDAPTTAYNGYSQNVSGTFFAPGASNAGEYNNPTKWNYAPPSGGPTLATALFSARNRMNNTWGPLGTTSSTTFKKANL